MKVKIDNHELHHIITILLNNTATSGQFVLLPYFIEMCMNV